MQRKYYGLMLWALGMSVVLVVRAALLRGVRAGCVGRDACGAGAERDELLELRVELRAELIVARDVQ